MLERANNPPKAQAPLLPHAPPSLSPSSTAPRLRDKQPVDKAIPPASVTLQQPKLPRHRQNTLQGDLQLQVRQKGS